jgi:hypothetical protein
MLPASAGREGVASWSLRVRKQRQQQREANPRRRAQRAPCFVSPARSFSRWPGAAARATVTPAELKPAHRRAALRFKPAEEPARPQVAPPTRAARPARPVRQAPAALAPVACLAAAAAYLPRAPSKLPSAPTPTLPALAWASSRTAFFGKPVTRLQARWSAAILVGNQGSSAPVARAARAARAATHAVAAIRRARFASTSWVAQERAAIPAPSRARAPLLGCVLASWIRATALTKRAARRLRVSATTASIN